MYIFLVNSYSMFDSDFPEVNDERSAELSPCASQVVHWRSKRADNTDERLLGRSAKRSTIFHRNCENVQTYQQRKVSIVNWYVVFAKLKGSASCTWSILGKAYGISYCTVAIFSAVNLMSQEAWVNVCLSNGSFDDTNETIIKPFPSAGRMNVFPRMFDGFFLKQLLCILLQTG